MEVTGSGDFGRALELHRVGRLDDAEAAVGFVLEAGPTLGVGHQTWQLNEVNKLIWPSENGIGALDVAAWDSSVEILTTYGIIKEAPTEGAYRTDLAAAALELLAADDAEADYTGADYVAAEVEITANGE